MLRRAGFGNRDDVAAADDPGQGNRGGRALVRGADLCQRAVTYHEVVATAERGIRHHRHIVLLAPWQQITLDVTVVETVRDLIGRTPRAVWNAEQIFHLAGVEVGYAPGANLSRRAQWLECRHDAGEFTAGNRPVQQIEIEVVGAETRETRRASPRDAIAGDLLGLDLRDQEHALALAGNRVTDEFLGAAVAVVSRRIDQRHAERNAGAHRLFLDSRRMPSTTEV